MNIASPDNNEAGSAREHRKAPNNPCRFAVTFWCENREDRMDKKSPSLIIKIKSFEATAQGRAGLFTLVVLACLALGARAFGLW